MSDVRLPNGVLIGENGARYDCENIACIDARIREVTARIKREKLTLWQLRALQMDRDTLLELRSVLHAAL
jgi:hypothetical protein